MPFGTHALQACTIDRSVTHPLLLLLVLLLVIVIVLEFLASIERAHEQED